MRRLLGGLLAAALAAGCVAGGAAEGEQSAARKVTNPLVEAVAALCDARAAPPARASDIFLNRSHEALHTLAAPAGKEHRAVAARLLETMEGAEAVLDARPTARHAARAIARLRLAAGRALEALHLRPPSCAG